MLAIPTAISVTGSIAHIHRNPCPPRATLLPPCNWFEDSPAGRLLEEKREEWNKEIDEAAELDFKERRARRPMVRIEHKPSVDTILDL